MYISRFNTLTNRFASGQGYTYDANGSLTVDATGQRYVLDAENRQTGLEDGSSNKLAEYAYDGEGKRVRKLISSSNIVTHFVYDAGGTLIEEWTTTPPMERNGLPSVSTTSYVYAGSRLISTETGSATTYVTLDHLGSTRVTTDGGGNVTSRKDFMAFGEEAITVQRNVGVGYGTPPVRQDYTGYEKEAESGLEFAQARYQNPVHGRFTSVDPLTASATIKNPQTFNRYSYALNSPYKFTDPLGLLSEYTTGACGGRCANSDGGGGGYTGYYYSGQLQGWQESLVDEFVRQFGLKKLFATFPGLRFENPKSLKVRVQDPKQLVSAETRTTMENEISSIYKEINVIVEFVAGEADYYLTIALNNEGYTKARDAFGATLPSPSGIPTETGYVFVEDIMKLARTSGIGSTAAADEFNRNIDKNLGVALGRAGSHEIAHYLLRNPGHESRGILTSTFYGSDWFGGGEFRAKWYFSGKQKKAIRATLPDRSLPK